MESIQLTIASRLAITMTKRNREGRVWYGMQRTGTGTGCLVLLCSALLYSTLLYPTLLYSTLLSTLLYFTLPYPTLLYSTLLYSTLLCSTLLYSTLLYSALLCSALLCSQGTSKGKGRRGGKGEGKERFDGACVGSGMEERKEGWGFGMVVIGEKIV